MALITKLNEIAQAIGRKTGQPSSTYNINNMASAIDNIQTDFPVVPPTPIPPEVVYGTITFIDYDGTIVAQFNVEDASEITSLPEIPTHPGMTATGWTATLAEVQNATSSMMIGATYQNSEDPTQTILQIMPTNNQTITLNLNQTVANSVTIDWGDGSATETSSTAGDFTVTHTYTYTNVSELPFEISLTPSEGTTLGLGHGTSAKRLFNNTTTFYLPIIAVIGKTTEVKDYAFYTCYGLQAVTLPNSGLMTSTPYYAFSTCTSLKTLILPNTVTTITGGSRSSTTSAWSNGSLYNIQADVVIPSSVTTIGPKAFASAYTKAVVIPDGVTTIGDNAFEGSFISYVRLPNNPNTTLGVKVFRACPQLKEIDIPELGDMGDYIFSQCRNIKSVTLDKVGGRLFTPIYSGPSGSTSDYNAELTPDVTVTMTDRVTSIPNYAFYRCGRLRSIVIPSTVTSIGQYCFSECYNLESVTIPSTVTTLDSNYMFDSCINLRTITFLNQPTYIGRNMFQGCYLLESITIPATVTTLDVQSFRNCSGLETVTIPSAVTTIGNNAFDGCNKLSIIKFEDRASIPSTFSASSVFTSAAKPGVVTTLDFTEQTIVPTFDGTFFTYMPSYVKIKVPASLEAEWKTTTGWDTYASQIVGVSE